MFGCTRVKLVQSVTLQAHWAILNPIGKCALQFSIVVFSYSSLLYKKSLLLVCCNYWMSRQNCASIPPFFNPLLLQVVLSSHWSYKFFFNLYKSLYLNFAYKNECSLIQSLDRKNFIHLYFWITFSNVDGVGDIFKFWKLVFQIVNIQIVFHFCTLVQSSICC